jgi:hypothetical protein
MVRPPRRQPPHSGNNNGGVSTNLVVMVVVSLASFFAGTLFSLQAAIGNQVTGSSASEIESMVAARVQEGTFVFRTEYLQEGLSNISLHFSAYTFTTKLTFTSDSTF